MSSLTEACELLRQGDNWLILTHRQPDGDTIGSAAALCLALRSLGKRAYVLHNRDITPRLSPFVRDLEPEAGFEPDNVVSVDLPDRRLMTPEGQRYLDRVLLAIDHHGTHEPYAGHLLLDSSAPAAAQVLWRVLLELKVTPTPRLATALYLGLATDTGCFRFSSVNGETHRAAAWCLEHGADQPGVNYTFFQSKTPACCQLEKQVMNSAAYSHEGQICMAVLRLRDIEAAGGDDDDRSGLSSMLTARRGVRASALMTESEEGWKVSARSFDPADVSRVCQSLGGGGHRNAAGCTMKGSLEDCYGRLEQALWQEVQRHV